MSVQSARIARMLFHESRLYLAGRLVKCCVRPIGRANMGRVCIIRSTKLIICGDAGFKGTAGVVKKVD